MYGVTFNSRLLDEIDISSNEIKILLKNGDIFQANIADCKTTWLEEKGYRTYTISTTDNRAVSFHYYDWLFSEDDWLKVTDRLQPTEALISRVNGYYGLASVAIAFFALLIKALAGKSNMSILEYLKSIASLIFDLF